MKKCTLVLLNADSLKKKYIDGTYDIKIKEVFIPIALSYDDLIQYNKIMVNVDNNLYDVEQISVSIFKVND